MKDKIKQIVQLPFWRNTWTLFSLWMLMVIISVGLHMHNFNNFLIYKFSYWHAVQGVSLYENHGDHYDVNFCKAMDEAGKPLVSSFVENAAFGEIKAKAAAGGKPDVFKIRDVLIRTFRVDHAKEAWGIDFTTAFEMKIGKFRLLHTGDCGVANDKLRVEWEHPDLWLLFPMTSLDVTDAFNRIRPKRCAFGHLWELGHAVGKGRATEWHIRRGLDMAARAGGDPVVAFWGDRIC